MKRKIPLLMILVLCILLCSGCKSQKIDNKKIRDLEYTVVEESEIPEEIMTEIEANKAGPMKLTKMDDKYLYVIVGYGEKPTGGYSISVDQFYLTSNSIYIETNLIGPSAEDKVSKAVTYPYVVVKTEKDDKIVVFN